jgi:hypothetical protein
MVVCFYYRLYWKEPISTAKKTKEYISNFNQFAPFYKVYSFAHKKSWRPWRLGVFFSEVVIAQWDIIEFVS